MGLIGTVLAGVLLVPGAPPAAGSAPSVYFEQTTTTRTDADPAGPGVVSRVWHAGRRMRLEAGGGSPGPALILRLDEGRAWRLDPERRQATLLDLERLRARSQMDAAMAADLMGIADDGAARVTELGRTRTIAGHACDSYRIGTSSAVLELCLARDIPVGIETFTAFLEWSGASAAMPGVLEALARLKGFPLETRSRVEVLERVHETVSRVTAVKLGPLPASLFVPPADYEIVRETPAELEPE
jgi:hypothetical protein